MKLVFLPTSYWHEFLDMIFFFKVVTGSVRTATVMLLTLFQGNVILSLFRDLFEIEPPESGTPSQMTFNIHATFRSVSSNLSCIRTV